MQIPKPKREIDKAYLQYIRSQHCIVSNQKAEPHHTRSRGAGGSDYLSVPLSHILHVECHAIGQATFQEKYRVSFDRAIERLLLDYIENRFGVRLVGILIGYMKSLKANHENSNI
ncbi:DUF968 domain-containing protein [Candidatus Bathyarchaeota archaeon]|nr:DUF968 domain-containing protein [Candidatus Bathyarchaeota archaeon]